MQEDETVWRATIKLKPAMVHAGLWRRIVSLNNTKMPRACPVESHARCYQQSRSRRTKEATGLPGGVSRWRLPPGPSPKTLQIFANLRAREIAVTTDIGARFP
jgi:hypothetical protein